MTQAQLFISDLHLEDSRPDITAGLFDFLELHAGRCEALYILGDLFEVWIGDDDITPLSENVAAALSEFSRKGSEVFIMHGNRDFLIGEEFTRRCAATLIAEPHELQTAWGNYLLVHGDSLCTDDKEYMKFRDMVRNPQWQKEFLGQSLAARSEFARQAREQSQAATASKATTIMDVNQQAVLELLEAQQLNRLIHGHTHRPAVHELQLSSREDQSAEALRLVLGDWDKQGWYAELNQGGLALHHFPLPAI